MKRKYLFSPVGNTDPIKYFRDGSLLHICRHYKPDVVYLYMSKEMLENHKKDNRYVKALELLGEKIQHTFEIHIIGNSEMIEVQQYDVFYNEFRDGIRRDAPEIVPLAPGQNRHRNLVGLCGRQNKDDIGGRLLQSL